MHKQRRTFPKYGEGFSALHKIVATALYIRIKVFKGSTLTGNILYGPPNTPSFLYLSHSIYCRFYIEKDKCKLLIIYILFWNIGIEIRNGKILKEI